MMRKYVFYTAFFVLITIFTASMLSSWIAPYDPVEPRLDHIKQPPSLSHWMGTDDRGRDVLSRILVGGKFSIAVGLVSTVCALLVGVALGFLSGYFGGWCDSVVSLMTNITLAFPSLLLAIGLSSAMKPGWRSVFFTLVAIGWAGFARLVRAQTLKLRTSPHVEAARVLGAGNTYIFVRHILPLCSAVLITAVTLRVGVAILTESSLSFLGLGLQPPAPTWGGMVNQGRDFFRSAPWITLFPGMIITITIICLNIFGENFRLWWSKRFERTK